MMTCRSEIKTPVKAIRAKCLDCCAGQTNEVCACVLKKCALWPYRMGHRPKPDKDINHTGKAEKSADRRGVFENGNAV